MLNKGDAAPDFEATDQHGNGVKLSALLEKGPVLLYFYPADFSPVCTAQACAFRDRADALEGISVQVLGVSPQSPGSHQRFAASYDIGFPLIADQDKRIIRRYGVDGPLGFGVRRATFLIEPNGRIGKRVVSDLFVGSHTDFVRAVLDGAATGNSAAADRDDR